MSPPAPQMMLISAHACHCPAMQCAAPHHSLPIIVRMRGRAVKRGRGLVSCGFGIVELVPYMGEPG